MPLIIDVLRLVRLHQWIKNAFVLAGLLFSGLWQEPQWQAAAMKAFFAFCCSASLIYIINDWHDREADARHPKKKSRPLARNALPGWLVLALAALLVAAALALAWGNGLLLAILAVYVALNLAYSRYLKHVPVVDVSIIASGFMLRLLAGTVAIGIPPSNWMLLTGLFVALLLGFAKRKAESFHAEADRRAVMEHYPAALLDTYIAFAMTATITTYALFATSAQAQLQHGARLVYTVPVVIFALLRFVYRLHQGHGEDVSKDLVRDPWIFTSIVLWLLIVVQGA